MKKKIIQATEALFDDAELDLIRANVRAKGDAMGKALFELSQSGLRSREILSCRLNKGNAAEDLKAKISIYKFPRGNCSFNLVALGLSTRAWVDMRDAKCGDYLFPDPKNANQPLAVRIFLAITVDWFQGTELSYSRCTFANLRRSVIAKKSNRH